MEAGACQRSSVQEVKGREGRRGVREGKGGRLEEGQTNDSSDGNARLLYGLSPAVSDGAASLICQLG